MLGYHPQVILAGRRINDNMGKFIAEQVIKRLIQGAHPITNQPVVVLGLTFKEDVPDLRNSKVIDVVRELQSFGVKVHVHDPLASSEEALHEYGVALTRWDDLPVSKAVIAAVGHRTYRNMPLETLTSKLCRGGVFADVKSAYDRAGLEKLGYSVWRL
jgi:UDP-N-acetyl-D-galactosamine dehydrogenase